MSWIFIWHDCACVSLCLTVDSGDAWTWCVIGCLLNPKHLTWTMPIHFAECEFVSITKLAPAFCQRAVPKQVATAMNGKTFPWETPLSSSDGLQSTTVQVASDVSIIQNAVKTMKHPPKEKERMFWCSFTMSVYRHCFAHPLFAYMEFMMKSHLLWEQQTNIISLTVPPRILRP